MKGDTVMTKHFRNCALWLAILALTLLAAPTFAQVPQHITYTGRLVDGSGNPLPAELVELRLRVYDTKVGGDHLWEEMHLDVSLDGTGGFSVQLGLGIFEWPGPLDASLFSDASRWLEVAVFTGEALEVLTPRQRIASVPWALVAERVAAWDSTTPRFEDCGDGTVADHKTGLVWEKKTGALGDIVYCEPAGCPDPHIVNNAYEWSVLGADPDGDAFTNFLARLNAKFDPQFPTGCFTDRCDWRLPEISELQTILIGEHAAPGQAETCSGAPCIDPDFAAVGGPTASWYYWSASANGAHAAWAALFDEGLVLGGNKAGGAPVRAVRAGSCN
jgi:hypothetical protein